MHTHATHEVTNQGTPWADVNLFHANRPLVEALRALVPSLLAGPAGQRLALLGAEAGSSAMQEHARLANTHAPVLHTHDRWGHRIDEVEFHPSYHALLGSALGHGLHGTPWAAGAAPGSHVERAVGFMLFTEAEPSVLCPVSMSYAVTAALRSNGGLFGAVAPGLVSRAYDPRFVPIADKLKSGAAITMGMGMTEKQGGSDVRANTTRALRADGAERDGSDAWGERYVVAGHKWFFSAPMCDAFLVLAQTEAGLSCLFMPRWRPDGSLNAIRIQRLKHKLGNHANASSEVEFDGAHAWLVGEQGRGIPQILAMGALTRLDCALGTAGLMRQALGIALHHAAERKAFGKRLVEHALMKNVLADLALESEAATLLALRLAIAVDATEHGRHDAHESVMRRLLTPVAKFWVCKRGSAFAQEAMECLGGNGYVEAGGQGVMARIYREMPLNSIWEGAGNIMALDLLRALRGADVAPALEHEFASARGANRDFDALAGAVLMQIDGTMAEAQARRLARDVALLLQASLLQRVAPAAVFDAFCDARLAAGSDVFGQLPARHDLDGLLARALDAGSTPTAGGSVS
jgi:putative acyl-CoA dehydrogenase